MTRWFTRGWIAWGVAFLVLETLAKVSKTPNATLSAHVWDYSKGDSELESVLRKAALAGGMIWLTHHLINPPNS